jgi:hypothetical protein
LTFPFLRIEGSEGLDLIVSNKCFDRDYLIGIPSNGGWALGDARFRRQIAKALAGWRRCRRAGRRAKSRIGGN